MSTIPWPKHFSGVAHVCSGCDGKFETFAGLRAHHCATSHEPAPRDDAWLLKDQQQARGEPACRPSGVQTYKADWFVFVDYANNEILGWTMEEAARAVREAPEHLRVFGTSDSNTRENTGYGVKVKPASSITVFDGSSSMKFVPADNRRSKKRAEEEALRIFRSLGWSGAPASLQENKELGIDLYLVHIETEQEVTVQVKCRYAHQKWPLFFFQTHENNDEGTYGENHPA